MISMGFNRPGKFNRPRRNSGGGGGGFPDPIAGYQWAQVGSQVSTGSDLGPIGPGTPTFGDDGRGYPYLAQVAVTQPLIIVANGQSFRGVPVTGEVGDSMRVTIATSAGLITGVDSVPFP